MVVFSQHNWHIFSEGNRWFIIPYSAHVLFEWIFVFSYKNSDNQTKPTCMKSEFVCRFLKRFSITCTENVYILLSIRCIDIRDRYWAGLGAFTFRLLVSAFSSVAATMASGQQHGTSMTICILCWILFQNKFDVYGLVCESIHAAKTFSSLNFKRV